MARPRRRNLKKLKTAENPRMEAAKKTMCTQFRSKYNLNAYLEELYTANS